MNEKIGLFIYRIGSFNAEYFMYLNQESIKIILYIVHLKYLSSVFYLSMKYIYLPTI